MVSLRLSWGHELKTARFPPLRAVDARCGRAHALAGARAAVRSLRAFAPGDQEALTAGAGLVATWKASERLCLSRRGGVVRTPR